MNMRTIKNWRITFMSFIALSLTACTAQNGKRQQPKKTTFQMTLIRPPYVFPNPATGRYQKIRMKRTNNRKINIM